MIFETIFNLLQAWGVISAIELVVSAWWWLFLPAIFFFPFRFMYKWWVEWELWYPANKWILLRIIPPKEIINPFKEMEDVYNILFGIHDGPNWREQWCEGELKGGPYWLSWEIASIGGRITFYVRCLDVHRSLIEDTLYSHFPEIEIELAEDYTQNVPQDVPNKDWDMYTEDYTVLREQAFPIKTYPVFFEESPEAAARTEGLRIDPLDSMLEAMSRLHPSEQLWFQIVTAPVLPGDCRFDVVREGKELINKIAQRPEPKSGGKSILSQMIDVLIWGKVEEPEEEKPSDWLSAPELRLTSGEKDQIRAVERKISKQIFKTWIRIVYVHKRKEPFFKGNYKIIRSYFNHFAHSDWNGLVFWGSTRSRIHYWMGGRRLYLRKRKNFRNYIARLPSLFPRTMDGEPMFEKGLVSRSPGLRGTAMLNSEELATIYHFPAKISSVIAPALLPIEAKKAGPPVGLPTEGISSEPVPEGE